MRRAPRRSWRLLGGRRFEGESHRAGGGGALAVHGRNRMSGIDERRVAALAKMPPRILRGQGGVRALEEARKLVECVALMHREKPSTNPQEGGHA